MMTKMKCFILFCLFLVSDGKEDDREPKFFFGPKLQTVVSYKRIPQFVTEYVPSSCVVIEPTLLPCRHVRNLEIYPSVPTRITKTQTPDTHSSVDNHNWRPVVQSSETAHHRPTPPLQVKQAQQVREPTAHWSWNPLNIFRVENITYTTTKTEYVTTRVEDPRTVVSFYIRGCRPSRLPFSLPECPRKAVELKQEESVVVMAPLKFVPSESLIIPSKTEEETKMEEEKEKAEAENSPTESNK